MSINGQETGCPVNGADVTPVDFADGQESPDHVLSTADSGAPLKVAIACGLNVIRTADSFGGTIYPVQFLGNPNAVWTSTAVNPNATWSVFPPAWQYNFTLPSSGGSFSGLHKLHSLTSGGFLWVITNTIGSTNFWQLCQQAAGIDISLDFDWDSTTTAISGTFGADPRFLANPDLTKTGVLGGGTYTVAAFCHNVFGLGSTLHCYIIPVDDPSSPVDVTPAGIGDGTLATATIDSVALLGRSVSFYCRMKVANMQLPGLGDQVVAEMAIHN